MDSGSDEGKVWATSVASGRPDSSVLLRKPGDVFDLQFSIRPPGHGKQQVREPVDPSDDIWADRFGMRQLHDLPLGPPRDRSGHVEAGGNFGAARKHKSGHGCISRFHFVDELFHLGHRRVGETHGFFLVGRCPRGWPDRHRCRTGDFGTGAGWHASVRGSHRHRRESRSWPSQWWRWFHQPSRRRSHGDDLWRPVRRQRARWTRHHPIVCRASSRESLGTQPVQGPQTASTEITSSNPVVPLPSTSLMQPLHPHSERMISTSLRPTCPSLSMSPSQLGGGPLKMVMVPDKRAAKAKSNVTLGCSRQ